MTIWDAFDKSPYLFTFILLFAMSTISNIWNRFWRHLNIRKHGYPTHCDADGNFNKNE